MALKPTYHELKQTVEALQKELADRAQAAKHHKNEAALYQAIFEGSRIPILLWDPATVKQILFNKATYLSLGYNRQEYDRLDPTRHVLLNGGIEYMQKDIEQTLQTGSSVHELQVMTKDGQIRYVLVNLVPIDVEGKTYIQDMVIDITDRKRAENQLRESEAFSFSILEHIPSPLYVIDKDLTIKYVNPALISLSGYTPQESLGAKVPFPWWKDKDNTFLIEEWKGHAVKGINNFKTGFRKKNGADFWVLVSSTPIHRHGEFQYCLFSWVDLTDLKRAEDEEKSLRIKFERAQRMEALGTLAGGVAHDFNNLLMAIQGRASILLLDQKPGDSGFEQLQGILDCVKTAATLTSQLLGFARGGKYEITPFNINELADTVVLLFGRTKKEIQIHTRFCEDIWTVEADKGQIDQVLMNILINAWQAMPGGGHIYVETGNIEFDAAYVKAFEVPPGKYVTLSIRDTGVGMDAATKERIFEPFFSTKGMGLGTGLGLASAYGIIKNHKGFIDVYSEAGKGTIFKIYLPASNRRHTREEKVSEQLLFGTETILLIDDEAMIIGVGKAMLEKLGYTVITAQGGENGVAAYDQHKDKIAGVILDMIMPGTSGSETFDKLQAVNPDVRVLLSSGYSIDGQAHDILNRGCKGFIQKPFTIHELSHKLREVLDKNCGSGPKAI